jgi:AmmeMemoRadiSam system protein B
LSVRKPTVAGQFYEGSPKELLEQVKSCFLHRLGPQSLPKREPSSERRSLGFIVPHAGYMYSGPVAAHSYYVLSEERKPTVIVLVGPNHSGVGPSVSVYPGGYWETPLGKVPVNAELAKLIVEHSKFARLDTSAHEYEHSIEVQIPFLQYVLGDGFSIVPITMLNQTPKTAEDVAKATITAAQTLYGDPRNVVIIATTDLTHYEPYEVAYVKDKLVLDKILSLDPEGLFKTVLDREISMCGPGSVMTLLYVAKTLNAKTVKLLKYATSGDVTGEKGWVVGYASVQILLL